PRLARPPDHRGRRRGGLSPRAGGHARDTRLTCRPSTVKGPWYGPGVSMLTDRQGLPAAGGEPVPPGPRGVRLAGPRPKHSWRATGRPGRRRPRKPRHRSASRRKIAGATLPRPAAPNRRRAADPKTEYRMAVTKTEAVKSDRAAGDDLHEVVMRFFDTP